MFNNKTLENSMLALKNGDQNAFDIIYEETNRLVYYIVYQILKNHQRTEEIVQDVYLKVYQKIDSYTNSPKAWISTIAKNLAINAYNKYKHEVIVEDVFDEALDVKEETPLIDLASRVLSHDDFMIVMLCVCEDYTRKEVGKLLNLSTSGVTWKLNNALEILKREVQNEK